MYRMLLISLSMLLVATGCSDGGPPVAPVSGVVTYEGDPVPHAKVMFFPQNVPGGNIGFARTDEDGKFSEVLTGGTRKGAVVGTHFVTVNQGWPPDEEIPMDAMGMEKEPPRGPWAQKYRDSTDPALKVEVMEGTENHFEFELSE